MYLHVYTDILYSGYTERGTGGGRYVYSNLTDLRVAQVRHIRAVLTRGIRTFSSRVKTVLLYCGIYDHKTCIIYRYKYWFQWLCIFELYYSLYSSMWHIFANQYVHLPPNFTQHYGIYIFSFRMHEIFT